jgi:hypothetical protein
MIVAPGLRLPVGGIMKRENLQGMTLTTGDVTIVEAGAKKGTIGTTIEL